MTGGICQEQYRPISIILGQRWVTPIGRFFESNDIVAVAASLIGRLVPCSDVETFQFRYLLGKGSALDISRQLRNVQRETSSRDAERLHRTRYLSHSLHGDGSATISVELRDEVRRWADEMLAKSPTALRVLKHSFNADSESVAGIGTLAWDHLELFVNSPEAREGVEAFNEKRDPDFSKYRTGGST